VPDVRVTVIDAETGSRRDTVTSGTGLYRVTALPPGTYSVEGTKAGFRSVIRENIVLTVAQVERVDLRLAVGTLAETITVSSAAPALDTESASLGRVVQQQAVVDLPLNGRNYLALAKLTPGVMEPAHGDPTAVGGAFTANGVRAQLTNYNLDGADNNSRIVDVQNQSYEVVQPSVDALDEFKIETSNYSAEYGYSAGAVVNATIKSGTNRIHGDVFEFLRNQHLDARDFFLPATQAKQFHIRNQYGGVFGAPIVKNKTFFFVSWERTAEDQGVTLTTTLPTLALRNGNFQGAPPIYDPGSLQQTGTGFTRTQFPNNLIPQGNISPIAARLVSLLPAPNLPGTVNNYVVDPNQVTRANRMDSRGDQSFSDNDKLFLRHDYLRQRFLNPAILPAPLIGATANTQNNHDTDAQSATVGETHSFGPQAVNEAQIGYSRIFDLRGDLVPGAFLASQYGIQGITPYPDLGGLPQMSITGYSSLGETANVPNGKVAEVLQARESVSWMRGNHTFKFGGQYEWVRSYFDVSSTARGSFSFTGAFTQNPLSRSNTGNGFADFLVGVPNSATVSTEAVGDVRQKYSAAFAQDDWKVNARLTINAGVRWEFWTPRIERHDQQANFVPGVNALIYPFNLVPAGISPAFTTIIPSGVGARSLVRSYAANFAPRLGVAYQLTAKTVLRTGAGVFYASPNFPGVGVTPPANPPYLISNTYATDQIHPVVTLASGFPPNALSPQNLNLAATTLDGFELAFKPTLVYKWSFGLEQQLSSFVAGADYVATKGTHMPFFYNLNQPLPGGTSVAARRPLRGLSDINFDSVVGDSTYEALQLHVDRRFAHGLLFQLSYTYSKTEDDGGEQLDGDTQYRNAQNLKAEHSLAAFDERNRFVTDVLYQIPVGKGKALNIQNPLLDVVIGGWQANGILTIRSGQPFTPELNFNTANTTAGDNRPNRIGNGDLPSGQRTIQRWFDTSAFIAAASYNFGNAGRNILIGPGATNVDFSLFKSFAVPFLGEAGTVQFRSEFFNTLNHPQFALPNATVNIPQGGTITSTASPMRQIQFGLKLIF
ncbi:MAG: TonB-dependent receptor, partial [Acidobacteriaceae bacterium]|nr:TonB-dependent receptor [Acidobacteriaceae bacterium]